MRRAYERTAGVVIIGVLVAVFVVSSFATARQLMSSPAPTKDPKEYTTQPNLVLGPGVSLPPKETVGPPLTPAPIPSRTPGIAETGLAPLPSEFYTIRNQWLGVEDGHYVIVYAGALTQQPSRGIVVVQTMSFDLRSRSDPQVLTAPQTSGALRIIAFSGLTLTLASASGTTLTFDVTGRLFP